MIQRFLESEPEVEVPPPGLIYWKAEIRARRESLDRATRPLVVVQWAAASGLAAGIGVLGFRAGSSAVALAALGAALLAIAALVLVALVRRWAI